LPPRSRTVCAAERPARPPPTIMTWAMVNEDWEEEERADHLGYTGSWLYDSRRDVARKGRPCDLPRTGVYRLTLPADLFRLPLDQSSRLDSITRSSSSASHLRRSRWSPKLSGNRRAMSFCSHSALPAVYLLPRQMADVLYGPGCSFWLGLHGLHSCSHCISSTVCRRRSPQGVRHTQCPRFSQVTPRHPISILIIMPYVQRTTLFVQYTDICYT
jgi:hypothetical protein